jgi:hypothetical protein
MRFMAGGIHRLDGAQQARPVHVAIADLDGRHIRARHRNLEAQIIAHCPVTAELELATADHRHAAFVHHPNFDGGKADIVNHEVPAHRHALQPGRINGKPRPFAGHILARTRCNGGDAAVALAGRNLPVRKLHVLSSRWCHP